MTDTTLHTCAYNGCNKPFELNFSRPSQKYCSVECRTAKSNEKQFLKLYSSPVARAMQDVWYEDTAEVKL